MLKFGEGGPRDLSAARALFDAACAAGSIDGCTNHGFMLMMGEAGPRDIARAATLLDAACTANAPNEIGRASCRDRVCQYVYITVVAVYRNKKTYTRLKYVQRDNGTKRKT